MNLLGAWLVVGGVVLAADAGVALTPQPAAGLSSPAPGSAGRGQTTADERSQPTPAPARPIPSLLAPHRPKPAPLAPTPSVARERLGRESYVLRPAKDGTGDLVYDAGAFTARVADDGTVTFRGHSVTDFSWLPLTPPRSSIGVPSLQSSFAALLRRKDPPAVPPPDPRRPPPETTQLIPETSRFRPDPREGCRECSNIKFDLMPLNVSGRFDLTDELVRMNGADPHRIEKARFLVATREQRVGMAVKKHAANVRRAAAELPAMAASIACDDRLSRTDRRAILNALRADLDLATADGRSGAQVIADVISRYLDANDSGVACPP